MRQKSIKTLEKELIELSREYIVLRDESCCQHCGDRVYGYEQDLSHVFTKKIELIKYDEANLMVLCHTKCHLGWWHTKPKEAMEWFKSKYPERYEYLLTRKQANFKQFLLNNGLTRREWLEKQIESYKEKIDNYRIK